MLEGSNIKLRKIQENDLETLYADLEEAVFAKNGFVYDLPSANLFLEEFLKTGLFSDHNGHFLISDYKERIIGLIFFEKACLYDGYSLKFIIFEEKNRNKGLMAEALTLFSNFFFSYKNISRLQILIPDYHKAAIKTAQKSGYKLEGILKEACFLQGQFVDLCIYALLKSSFSKKQ